MKDLYKPGRDLNEYLNDDGTLQRHCITCAHRDNIQKSWGSYLCSGGQSRYWECQERQTDKAIYKFWEPRVDANAFITEEDIDFG